MSTGGVSVTRRHRYEAIVMHVVRSALRFLSVRSNKPPATRYVSIRGPIQSFWGFCFFFLWGKKKKKVYRIEMFTDIVDVSIK